MISERKFARNLVHPFPLSCIHLHAVVHNRSFSGGPESRATTTDRKDFTNLHVNFCLPGPSCLLGPLSSLVMVKTVVV